MCNCGNNNGIWWIIILAILFCNCGGGLNFMGCGCGCGHECREDYNGGCGCR